MASICRSVRVGPERVGDLQDCRRRLSLTQTHLYTIPPICRPLNGLTPQLALGTVSPTISRSHPSSFPFLSLPPTLLFRPTILPLPCDMPVRRGIYLQFNFSPHLTSPLPLPFPPSLLLKEFSSSELVTHIFSPLFIFPLPYVS